MKAFLLPGAIK